MHCMGYRNFFSFLILCSFIVVVVLGGVQVEGLELELSLALAPGNGGSCLL